MDPKQTIKKNIERRSKAVDIVELQKGLPKPSYVELSLIDVCNRKCVFCPKANDEVAPDTYQSMSRLIINKICEQLVELNFTGTISLCGYGEPLLHKDINYIVSKLSEVSKVEIVTNGDVLTSKKLQELYLAKASKVPSALHLVHGRSDLFPLSKFFLNFEIIFPVHILKIVSCIIFPIGTFRCQSCGHKKIFPFQSIKN